MEQVISITDKWQINIPKKIRSKMNLKKPGKALVKLEKNKIIIEPIESKILKLSGKYSHLKPVKKINITKIRDYIDYSKW